MERRALPCEKIPAGHAIVLGSVRPALPAEKIVFGSKTALSNERLASRGGVKRINGLIYGREENGRFHDEACE